MHRFVRNCARARPHQAHAHVCASYSEGRLIPRSAYVLRLHVLAAADIYMEHCAIPCEEATVGSGIVACVFIAANLLHLAAAG